MSSAPSLGRGLGEQCIPPLAHEQRSDVGLAGMPFGTHGATDVLQSSAAAPNVVCCAPLLPKTIARGLMMMNKLSAIAAGGIALCAAQAAPAFAVKWTVTCETARFAAYPGYNSRPVETLELKTFAVSVDTVAKSCVLLSAGAYHISGKQGPVSYVPDAKVSKCILNITPVGAVFMHAQVRFTAAEALTSPIVTLNYHVRSIPPTPGSSEAKGDYLLNGGFPLEKQYFLIEGSRLGTSCVQSKPGS
jgi:hypothetical protein